MQVLQQQQLAESIDLQTKKRQLQQLQWLSAAAHVYISFRTRPEAPAAAALIRLLSGQATGCDDTEGKWSWREAKYQYTMYEMRVCIWEANGDDLLRRIRSSKQRNPRHLSSREWRRKQKREVCRWKLVPRLRREDGRAAAIGRGEHLPAAADGFFADKEDHGLHVPMMRRRSFDSLGSEREDEETLTGWTLHSGSPLWLPHLGLCAPPPARRWSFFQLLQLMMTMMLHLQLLPRRRQRLLLQHFQRSGITRQNIINSSTAAAAGMIILGIRRLPHTWIASSCSLDLQAGTTCGCCWWQQLGISSSGKNVVVRRRRGCCCCCNSSRCVCGQLGVGVEERPRAAAATRHTQYPKTK